MRLCTAGAPGSSETAIRRAERGWWHEAIRSLGGTLNRTPTPRWGVTPARGGAGQPYGSDDLESTRTLLDLARSGDRAARDRLIARYLPALQSWARGRLPRQVRNLTDTDDLVQMTLLRAVERLDSIRYVHEGGFFAYLRAVLRSRIVDLLRKRPTGTDGEEALESVQAPGPSPFDEAVGEEIMAAYEAGLDTLTPQQSAAVSLRIELGFSFQEVADAVGCPSANAARMLVSRAIVRLSEVMDEHRTQ